MTDSEINIAIAEACGWGGCFLDAQKIPFGREPGTPYVCRIPIYTYDLNAMHEAEMTLSDEDCGSDEALADQYALNLLRIVGVWKDEAKSFDASFDWDNHCDADIHRAARATARQRAEAFLRTIGKWRDQ